MEFQEEMLLRLTDLLQRSSSLNADQKVMIQDSIHNSRYAINNVCTSIMESLLDRWPQVSIPKVILGMSMSVMSQVNL